LFSLINLSLVLAGTILVTDSLSQASDRVAAPAGVFSPLPPGVRGGSLVGAQTAAAEGIEALFHNPAEILSVEGWEGGYAHADPFGIVPAHYTAGIYHRPGQSWAAGAAWSRVGDEVFSENQVLLSAAWGTSVMRLGGTYKLRFAGTGGGGTGFVDPEEGLQRQVSGSAFGWLGFDVGLTARPFGSAYVFGIAFRDLLSRIQWDTQNEAGTAAGKYAEYVPVSMSYGFQFIPDPFLRFMADIAPSLYHDASTRLATGTECHPLELLPATPWKSWVSQALALRLGYGRDLFEAEDNHRLGLGAGLELPYRTFAMKADLGYEIPFALDDAGQWRWGVSFSGATIPGF
jgi:hypothetical protein